MEEDSSLSNTQDAHSSHEFSSFINLAKPDDFGHYIPHMDKKGSRKKRAKLLPRAAEVPHSYKQTPKVPQIIISKPCAWKYQYSSSLSPIQEDTGSEKRTSNDKLKCLLQDMRAIEDLRHIQLCTSPVHKLSQCNAERDLQRSGATDMDDAHDNPTFCDFLQKDQEIRELKAKVHELRDNNRNLEDKLETANEMIETLEIEAQLSEEREKQAEERKKKVEKEKNEAEEYVTRYDSAHEKLKKSHEDTLKDLQDKKNETEYLKELNNTLTTHVSDAELQIDILKERLSKSQLEIDILRKRLSETEKENEKLRNECSDTRQEKGLPIEHLEKIPDTSPLLNCKRKIGNDDHSVTAEIKGGYETGPRKKPKLRDDGKPKQDPRNQSSKRKHIDKKSNGCTEQGPKYGFTFRNPPSESMQAQGFFAGSDGKNTSSQASTASPSF
ncbi:hypothetical protein J3E72DRAFT_380173 [Bipolaris maydis]|nr:hypothetical protein J3E72DRAFT_380173 [Bipolaris maydis]